MERDVLKPCPFCGSRGEIHHIPKGVPDEIRVGKWVAGCDGPNGSLCPGYVWNLTPFYLTEEMAREYWNGRSEA